MRAKTRVPCIQSYIEAPSRLLLRTPGTTHITRDGETGRGVRRSSLRVMEQGEKRQKKQNNNKKTTTTTSYIPLPERSEARTQPPLRWAFPDPAASPPNPRGLLPFADCPPNSNIIITARTPAHVSRAKICLVLRKEEDGAAVRHPPRAENKRDASYHKNKTYENMYRKK